MYHTCELGNHTSVVHTCIHEACAPQWICITSTQSSYLMHKRPAWVQAMLYAFVVYAECVCMHACMQVCVRACVCCGV